MHRITDCTNPLSFNILDTTKVVEYDTVTSKTHRINRKITACTILHEVVGELDTIRTTTVSIRTVGSELSYFERNSVHEHENRTVCLAVIACSSEVFLQFGNRHVGSDVNVMNFREFNLAQLPSDNISNTAADEIGLVKPVVW